LTEKFSDFAEKLNRLILSVADREDVAGTLDALRAELVTQTKETFVSSLANILSNIAIKEDNKSVKVWEFSEYIIVEMDCFGSEIRNTLEFRLFAEEIFPNIKLIIYSILNCCGSTILFELVLNDHKLRLNNVLAWANMLVYCSPEIGSSLEIVRVRVISLLKSNLIKVDDLFENSRMFISKLGLGDLLGWLSRLRDATMPAERTRLSVLVDDCLLSNQSTKIVFLPVVEEFSEAQRQKARYYENSSGS
jgi:hypothetical protein